MQSLITAPNEFVTALQDLSKLICNAAKSRFVKRYIYVWSFEMPYAI
jgi:hypothetical protein